MGGRTSLGLDCSALVQTALNACGIPCPRDSDMQERDLGHAIDTGADLGGIDTATVYSWKGHVAMVRDASSIIHATGHTMTVIIEPLDGAMRRIGDAGESLQAVKRLG